MKNLLQGLHHFRSGVFQQDRELYTQLVAGQNPNTLFISCSDSRVVPALITQSGPGDLFELRNAGNLVPAFGASNGGESATIEFAVVGLGVRDVVVCGHTHCGAMKAMLEPSQMESMPVVESWLRHAETTRRIMREVYQNLPAEHRLNVAVQEHVLVQIENLQTHPCIAVQLQRQEINLHAWVYKLETGEVFAFSQDEERFVPLSAETRGLMNQQIRPTNQSAGESV
jgi:carbonic anhydrase